MRDVENKYLLPYVSSTIVNALSDEASKDSIIDGSLLFADISGFTAMSEKLAGMGRIGGEKLTEIINGCFNPLLEIVFDWDGDIIKFGGDAFLALFQGANRTRRAYNCASELINWINSDGKIKTPVGDFDLGVHVGISDGDIFSLIVGNTRKDHLFCGRTVEQAYAAADLANLGQVVITADAAEKLPNLELKVVESGFMLCPISEIDANKKPSVNDRLLSIEMSSTSDLGSFVDKRLFEQLHYNKGQIDGEHRIITNLFIGVSSLRRNLEKDSTTSINTIEKYFETINDIIFRNGGSLARIDSSSSSEKILVFFGAPKCFGNDAQSCIRAVFEIESQMKKLNSDFAFPLRHKYGINTGLCFVGNVGGFKRREYTAMGDAINLAARLMTNADNWQIIVGESTAKICENDFDFDDKGEISVKGKQKPIKIFSPLREKEILQQDSEMIGRDREIKQVNSFLNKVKGGKRGSLMISGEPGAGKSLLCAKLKQIAETLEISCYEGACYRQSEKTSYGPIKELFPSLLGITSKTTIKARKSALRDGLKQLGEIEWEPFVAPLLDYYPPPPPHLKNLPEETKKNKIRDIINRLIAESTQRKNAIIIIEDIQWVDSASFELIESLIKSKYGPGLLFVGRISGIPETLKNRPEIEEIELGALSLESSRELFLGILEDVRPDETIIGKVIEKSGGNPFYLEEMAKAFIELGEERFDSTENIPTGIESVITARIDNLGEMVKKTVRTASVIGRIFGYHVLRDIFPDRKRTSKLREYLNELANLDLTPVERIQPALEYIFKHILTQEVAYNGLAFSSRKSLHIKIAEYYSARKRLTRKSPETIARHFLQAEEDSRALPYLILSGKKAASEFANKEAFDYYRKALEIADKRGDRNYIIEALRHKGLLAKDTAAYKEAENDLIKLRDLDKDNIELQSFSDRELSFIYRMTGEYDKASVSLDRLEKLMSEDIPTRVFCLNGKAEIARRSGKLPRCRELLLEAVSIISDNPVDQELTAVVYNNLGICHWSLGKMNEAESYFKTALDIYRKLKDLSGQSKITNNLGIISDELGKLYHAASSYEKAEKIFKRIGASRSEAYACANLGTNLLSRGYLERSLEKLSRAKEIFENIGDSHTSAYTSGDLGYVQFCSGDIENAENLLATAVEKASEINDEELLLESKIRLGKIAVYSGRNFKDNASSLVSQAGKLESAELELKALILKALVELQMRNFDGFTETLKLISNKEELGNYPELKLENNLLQFVNELQNGDVKSATKVFKDALKGCFSRDLGLIACDFLAAGNATKALDRIPEKSIEKLRGYYNRIGSGLDKAGLKKLDSLQKCKETLFSGLSKYPLSAESAKPSGR